jgi:hypothetical protein
VARINLSFAWPGRTQGEHPAEYKGVVAQKEIIRMNDFILTLLFHLPLPNPNPNPNQRDTPNGCIMSGQYKVK